VVEEESKVSTNLPFLLLFTPSSFPFHAHDTSIKFSLFFIPFTNPFNNNYTSPSAFVDLYLQISQLKLNKPSIIVAFSGCGSYKGQEIAFENGVDIFVTSPVRIRVVDKILERWVRGRETEGNNGGGNIAPLPAGS
jgi:hypothetical protein